MLQQERTLLTNLHTQINAFIMSVRKHQEALEKQRGRIPRHFGLLHPGARRVAIQALGTAANDAWAATALERLQQMEQEWNLLQQMEIEHLKSVAMVQEDQKKVAEFEMEYEQLMVRVKQEQSECIVLEQRLHETKKAALDTEFEL